MDANSIETIGKYMFYLVNGELWRAPIGTPIDKQTGLPMGGRWEAPAWLVDTRLDMVREITTKYQESNS